LRTTLLLALLALATALHAGDAPAVLYQTDFEGQAPGSMPPGWAPLGGEWAVVADESVVLQQTQAAFRGLAQAGRVWSDYDVVATVRPLGGSGQAGVGLVGYWSQEGGCYRLSSYANTMALWRERGDHVQALAAASWEPAEVQAYRLRLSLRSGSEGTWVRGKVWAVTDKEPAGWSLVALDAATPLRGGHPGLFTGRAAAAFTDLQVRAANDELLVEDTLTGKTAPGWYWRFMGGDWQWSDGQSLPAGQQASAGQGLRQAAVNDGPAFSAASYGILAGWTDYTVQVSARAAPGSGNQGFGVSAYAQDSGACFQFGQLAGTSLFLARRMPGRGQVSLATVPLATTQGAWYTLRLEVATLADRVRLRGKIWPARAGEPVQWQIEAEDQREPALRGGDVGLWCLDDVCSFDDLLVRGND
jgi:hypothetical protein